MPLIILWNFQTDVTGECEVSYNVETGTDAVETITKVKDYSKCVGRQQELMFSHFTPFSTGDVSTRDALHRDVM